MKNFTRNLLIIAVLVTSIAFAKTVYVTGPIVSDNVKVKSFSKLDVRSQFDVFLTQGNKEELMIETYQSLLPYVKVEQEKNTLRIYLDKKLNKIKWNNKDHLLIAHVTVKDLDKISLSGACDLYMETDLKTDDLKISASGASDLDLMKIEGENIKILTSGASDIDEGELIATKVTINASGASDGDIKVVANVLDMIASGASDFDIDVDVKEITINAHGSSDFNAKGNTQTFVVNVSGSSEMKAYNLVSDTVIIEASGSSNCRVNAIKVIDASSSGASSIYYVGNPDKTKISVSGVSTIKSK